AFAANEARSENDVGAAVSDGRQHLHVLVRVVFQVGVLHDDHVTGGLREPRPQRGALALIDVVIRANQILRRRQSLKHVASAIGGAVVDDDDLFLEAGYGANPLDDLGNRGGFVVHGNDD